MSSRAFTSCDRAARCVNIPVLRAPSSALTLVLAEHTAMILGHCRRVEENPRPDSAVTDICPLVGNASIPARNYQSNENVRLMAQPDDIGTLPQGFDGNLNGKILLGLNDRACLVKVIDQHPSAGPLALEQAAVPHQGVT